MKVKVTKSVSPVVTYALPVSVFLLAGAREVQRFGLKPIRIGSYGAGVY